MYALNDSTGTKIWSYVTSSDIVSSPTVSGGAVYVGSFDGSFYALNASTGASSGAIPQGHMSVHRQP